MAVSTGSNRPIGKHEIRIHTAIQSHVHDFYKFLAGKKKRNLEIGALRIGHKKHCPVDFLKDNALENFPSIKSREYKAIAAYRDQNIKLWNGYLSLKRNTKKRTKDKVMLETSTKLLSEIRPNIHFKYAVDDIMNLVNSHVNKTTGGTVHSSEVGILVMKTLSHILTTDEFYTYALTKKGHSAGRTAMATIGNSMAACLLEQQNKDRDMAMLEHSLNIGLTHVDLIGSD